MTATPETYLDPRVEGRFLLRTDPHCHILPGMDDGSPDNQMSLRMARTMVAAGVKIAVATPHGIHPAIDTNVDPDFLRGEVARLNQLIAENGIPLKVVPGTEVFLRRRVMAEFEAGRLMTWADQGRFILVELGFQRRSTGVLDVIDQFIAAGLVPIIAHPERYLWLPSDAGLFVELRDRGCVFQFNMMSINGYLGPRTQALAFRLMPHSGEFIIGSDSHSDAVAKYFDVTAARKQLSGIGLLGDSGEVLAGTVEGVPDLSGL